MNKKLKILSLALLFTIVHIRVAIGQSEFSNYGGPFTPAGDLRILLVFAGFESDCNLDRFSGHTDWPIGSNCSGLPTWANNLFYDDFSDFNANNNDQTLSNFMYQSSRLNPSAAPLRVVADVFPKRVNITGTSPSNYSVLQKLDQDPQYNTLVDWSRFDNKINNPNFKNDYSAWGNADGVIDYVVIIWRNAGLAGVASTTSYTTGANFATNSNCGFTMNKTLFNGDPGIKHLFLHELSHSLFNYPHLNNENGVHGIGLHTSEGWGFMSSNYINFSANAFERWYLGWLNVPNGKHITSATQNGIYTLQDFNTTGDFMVIDLPFTTQRLWLENHNKTNSFEEKNIFGTDGCGTPLPAAPKGILMFVEDLTFSRNTKLQPTSYTYANKMKSINANGNYDYSIQSSMYNSICAFNKNYYNLGKTANAFGPYNDLSWVRNNYAFEPNSNKIHYTSYTNCADPILCADADGTKCEELSVLMTNNTFDFSLWLGKNMAFGNTLPQKIGMSYNPAITNIQAYNKIEETLSPIFLNGISIKFNSKDAAGNITFEVKYNDTDIEQDQRLSGNLELNNIPNAVYDLNVKSGKELTINKSGTPDRITLQNGSFVNPTILTVKSGAVINTEQSTFNQYGGDETYVRIKDDSKVIFENGSTLNVGNYNYFLVQDNSYIEFNETANLNILQSSFVVEPNAELCIKNPNNVYLEGQIQYHDEMWYGGEREITNESYSQGKVGFFDKATMEDIEINAISDFSIIAKNEITFLSDVNITPTSTGEFIAEIGLIQTNCQQSSTMRKTTTTNLDDYSLLEEDNSFCFQHLNERQADDSFIISNSFVENEEISVSPVPANNYLNLESRIGNIEKVNIFDLNGKLRQTVNSEGSQIKLNLADLPSGVYILTIKTQHKISNVKFVKN